MLDLIDIITKDNRLTGYKTSPDDATNRGAWHRGAHAIIITPTGRVLVQRRSHDSIQFPGRLDIGVGGFVDSGETPEKAILREIKEETGLTVKQNQLIFLGTSRRIYRWDFRRKHKVSRTIIYNYAARLPREHNATKPERDEVEWVGFVPLKSALWLTHHGSIKRLGRIIPLYAYYRQILRQTTKFIRF
jgi:8-oxo-dGTP pyrophosphatase MutT (NUDIX family)